MPAIAPPPLVVLVGGVANNPRGWSRWSDALAARGVPSIAVASPRFGFAALEADLAAIDDAVRGARAAHPERSVALVGHSKGGIAAVEYLRRHPDEVHGVVTVASPHQGSGLANALARLRGGAIGRRLVPQLTTDLAARQAQARELPPELARRVTTIHGTRFDGIIGADSTLEGARNLHVPGSPLRSTRHDRLRTHNEQVRELAFEALGLGRS